MEREFILENVRKHIALRAKEEKYFLSLLETAEINRRDFLLRQGEICHYSTFVTDGALKSFTTDKDGNEHILSFAVRDWWIADMYSFVSRKPAVLNIQAVADSRVLLLSYENRERLFEEVPAFERMFRMLVENALVASQQRVIDNLSLTAEARYLNFISKYPFIPQCVPQHNIASYLGITPEFLSKIRARLSKRR